MSAMGRIATVSHLHHNDNPPKQEGDYYDSFTSHRKSVNPVE